eukprot:CAMPEP_0194145662 /NCGR_PEP_ID=MMETSP0152-20130528/18208_1 /TAXON_ID=1049557 /ORGANISM="Thalassiothrix antarctica, Strain L6-D1" /LENGTH=228 /DNA_ID=CAMNT_0038845955 /DNA_START=234 /DNA_END=920 /DNA_ORIENTATION=+
MNDNNSQQQQRPQQQSRNSTLPLSMGGSNGGGMDMGITTRKRKGKKQKNEVSNFDAPASMLKLEDKYNEQKSQGGKEELPKLAKRGAKSSYERLKQYGPVFAGTYATVYIMTLGGLYGGVDTGFIDPATIMSHLNTASTSVEGEIVEESLTTAQVIIDYLHHYAWTQPVVPFLEKNPHLANLAVAWVATKFTEPLRLLVCFAVVPKLADYLGFVPTIEDEDDEKEEGN